MNKKDFLTSFFIFITILLALFLVRDFLTKKKLKDENLQTVSIDVLKQESRHLAPDLQFFLKTRDMHAGQSIRVTKRLSDQIIYQVVYDYDQIGLRNTKVIQGTHPHLIIAGCSGVFGEGVEEEQTLSSILSNLLSRPVLNFGIAGSAHHDHVEFLELLPPSYVQSSGGKYIFFLWDDLLKRAALDPSYLMWSGPHRPYFDFDDSGVVKRRGLIGDSDQWEKFSSARSIGLEHSYLSLKTTALLDHNSLHLNAGILLELKNTYLKRFPRGRFMVAFHPLFETKREHEDFLRTQFKQLNIDILENELIGQKTAPSFFIPHDGHPSVKGYQVFAKILQQALEKLSREEN